MTQETINFTIKTELRRLLKGEAERTGNSEASLIRGAIADKYSKQ